MKNQNVIPGVGDFKQGFDRNKVSAVQSLHLGLICILKNQYPYYSLSHRETWLQMTGTYSLESFWFVCKELLGFIFVPFIYKSSWYLY